jgi:hypothetical protein
MLLLPNMELTSKQGCAQTWTNYINRPLPKGGNGWGAVPSGSQATQGALGMGEQIANATTQSFNLIAYCLPVLVGYLADSRFGRHPMIFWGIILCGIGHVLIVAGGGRLSSRTKPLRSPSSSVSTFSPLVLVSVSQVLRSPDWILTNLPSYVQA